MSRITATTVQQAQTDTQIPTTSDGQPIDVSSPRSGSKEWEHIKKDRLRQRYRPSHPPLGARTTFWSRDMDSKEKRDLYSKYHQLQHGRQHPAEPYLDSYSEGWGGHKVRQEDVGMYRFGGVLLSRAGVNGYWLRRICRRLVREELRGFNSHYAGVVGATFGFAMLELCEDVEAAKASILAEEAQQHDQFDIDSEKLAEYVFDKYGGEQA